ncbi:MAG: hypothetical protein US89_C0010G0041 [Candidatus Peregrinibacteria bacterium GW2011_GWF2_38_29]|nr:MAG: hypothetical protein US89_C0010G0041 [Candidatus Peregrinibacteria bacterium GW2011_GWF2_38_29]
MQDLAQAMGIEPKKIKEIWAIGYVKSVSFSDEDLNGEENGKAPAVLAVEELLAEQYANEDDLYFDKALNIAAIKEEAIRLMDVFKIMQKKMGKTATSGSKLSKEDMLIRNFYILFRRLDLYDMPWADITLEDIAQECGIEREAVNQFVNLKMRPRIRKEMGLMGYSEEKLDAYDKLFDFWTRTHADLSNARSRGKVDTNMAKPYKGGMRNVSERSKASGRIKDRDKMRAGLHDIRSQIAAV